MASVEGANSVYWNPAGLGLLESHELVMSHMQYFEDSSHQYAALAVPLKKGKRGGFGLSVTRFAIDNIEARDATSSRIGTVEQEDVNIQVSYGVRLGKTRYLREGLFFGFGFKKISEELAGVIEETFAGDLGLQYRPGSQMAESLGSWVRRASVGLTSKNIGKGLTYDRVETELPQEIAIGLGYTHFLWGDALNLALDFRNPRGEDSFFSLGGEFWVQNMVAFRLGLVEGQDLGEEIRAGMGFRFKTIQLDYAWSGFGEELGDTHRFSLLLRFGENPPSLVSGLKPDLINYYLSQAQDALEAGGYHEAVLHANQVLEIEPRNPEALQILFEAGQKMNPEEEKPNED